MKQMPANRKFLEFEGASETYPSGDM
jgi:hypothetical protein